MAFGTTETATLTFPVPTVTPGTYYIVWSIDSGNDVAESAAGELDMYVALAKLYKSREGKEAHYCMVNFIENSTTPIIDAQNFWNPFINPDTVAVNNTTLDASCPNSILTGPNTGGKSTVIKGIMINILMAQTFGIAPAESLTLTPFSKLNCFMNISDDIATGASLFKSEVMRAKKLLDMVQELPTDREIWTYCCDGGESRQWWKG